jgi:hypothetical protein
MVNFERRFSTTIVSLRFSKRGTATVVIDPRFETRVGKGLSVMFVFARFLKRHTLYRHCA